MFLSCDALADALQRVSHGTLAHEFTVPAKVLATRIRLRVTAATYRPGKPDGTDGFILATTCRSRDPTDRKHFSGDRELVRESTVAHALQGVRERIA